MAGARNYKDSDIRRLFTLSGNQCSKPGCTNKMVSDDGQRIIGQICHIAAASPKGPRYSPEMTDNERRSFDNLILLCYEHHKEIDDLNVIENYPTELLLTWKTAHENKFEEGEFIVTDDLVQFAISEIEKSLVRIEDTTNKVLTKVSDLSESQIQILDYIQQSISQNNYQLVEEDNSVLSELNTKEFIEFYYTSLISEIALFQGIGIHNLYEDEFLYVEPEIIFNHKKTTRTQFLEQSSQSILFGASGTGKSFLLKKSIIDCLKGRLNTVPVYLNLNEYDYLDTNLIDLIHEKFYVEGIDSEVIFKSILKERNVLLMLDGYDEILNTGSRIKLKNEWLKLRQRYPSLKTIMTSRSTSDDIIHNFTEAKINPIDSESILKFIDSWSVKNSQSIDADALILNLKKSKLFSPSFDYQNDKMSYWSRVVEALSSPEVQILSEESYRIEPLSQSMLTSPLVLSFVCELYLKKEFAFNSYSDIFDNIIDFIFSKWNAKRIEKKIALQNESSISKFELIEFCQFLCYQMLSNTQLAITEKELYKITSNYFSDQNIRISNLETIYKSLHIDYGILKKSSHGLYSFFHTSFLEYLAAQYLATLPIETAKPIELFFIHQEKDVIKYYFEILSKESQIAFLKLGVKEANNFLLSEPSLVRLCEKVEQLVEEYYDDSKDIEVQEKEKILLFYFFLFSELICEFSDSVKKLLSLILERLLVNLRNKNLLHNGNYLYLYHFHHLTYYPEYIGNAKATEYAKNIQERYKDNPESKLTLEDLSTLIGYNGAKKLTKYLYIIERLLWLNAENLNIPATVFLNLGKTEVTHGSLENYEVDFFEITGLWKYITEDDSHGNELQLIRNAIPKIGKEFHYYELMAAHCLYVLYEYDLILEIVNTALNDYKLNTDFWEKNYDGEEQTLAVFMLDLHLYRAQAYFELATNSRSKEAYNIPQIEKSIEDYEKYPIEKLEHSPKTYYACALRIAGEAKDDKTLLQKSLMLYSESIEEQKDYIIGYLNAIILAASLKQFEHGKQLLLKLNQHKKESHYEQVPNLDEMIEKYEVLFNE